MANSWKVFHRLQAFVHDGVSPAVYLLKGVSPWIKALRELTELSGKTAFGLDAAWATAVSEAARTCC